MHGEHHGGHVCLLDLNAKKRSDKNFKKKKDVAHHNLPKISSLESELNFGMVSGFVLDYMHLCAIGIMKKILRRFQKSTPKEIKKHLSVKQKDVLQEKLSNLIPHIPSDYNRHFQSEFSHMSRWKATEMRLMMLYVGIVLFSTQDIIPNYIYEIFLLFSVSMKLLLMDGQHIVT